MSLWQKEQETSSGASTTPRASTPSKPGTNPKRSESRSGTPATIGQSVQINGELTGQEDLIIDGTIEGKVIVKGHNLTIGANGHIKAAVKAKSVEVSGEVSGNITADDKVEISPSGSVLGNIIAPRVALADGCRFKGSIDMGGKVPASPSIDSQPHQINRDVKIAAGPKS